MMFSRVLQRDCKNSSICGGKDFPMKGFDNPDNHKRVTLSARSAQPTSKPWKSKILKEVIFFYIRQSEIERYRSKIVYKLARVTFMQKSMSKSCK